MYLSDFNYHRPLTVGQACDILSARPDGVPLAGGTDLLVEMKQGLRHHQDLVSLTAIKELKVLEQDAANLFIGSGVTHNEVAAAPVLKESHPAIAEAALTIGTDQVRNTGTIGGNLCTAASCSDMAPILMALRANVEISNSAGVRTVPLSDFFIAHKKTCIQKGEIMTKIVVPLAEAGTVACYEKFGLREAASISVASVAVMIRQRDGICADAQIVIGAVASTPKISQGAMDVLVGKSISDLTAESPTLKKAGEAAALDSLPIDDIRGSAEYRRDLLKVLTRRTISKALSRASNN